MDQESYDTDPRLLDALSSLNQISTTVNRIGQGGRVSVETTLRLIVESSIKVVPGASAVIYAYDSNRGGFDSASRVSADEWVPPVAGDEPRPRGMGVRAIEQRRRVLSYEETDLDMHPVKVQAGARAVACYPLVVADQAVGGLYVYLHEDRRFSQLELLMLDNFVNQAAMAIYHARQITRHNEELARKEDEAIRMHRAGLLISSRVRLEETLEAILQMALEVINAQYGIFRLVDKRGENLITRAVAGEGLSQPLVEVLPVDTSSIMGWVAEHRQPVCIPDLRAEPWVHHYYPLDPDLEMRSELAVPLIGAGNRLEGVLNLESPQVGAFTDQDSHLLQALATQAVIAIQEVRLLDTLQEIAERLLKQPIQQLLEGLVDLACDLLNANSSAMWTVEGENLILRASSADFRHLEVLPIKGSLTGQAILSGAAVTAEDVRVDPRFKRPDLAHRQDWMRALIVPVLSSDDREPVGAFAVYRAGPDPDRFAESDWDIKVLTVLAHYAALALHNAVRQEALQAAQEQRAVAETFAAVGDIAANLLHHLNNKVGTIPVRVQGIQDKCQVSLQADPYLAANLDKIQHGASEAMKAMREGLTRIRPIHLGPIDVADCVSSAVNAANLPPGTRVHSVNLDSLPPVVAGENSLILVFTNLLENASHAMDGTGTITITGSHAPGNQVKIAVADTGPGISPDLHDRIFEFDFSGQSSKQPGRLGFGLWWVKTLMVRLGGTVSVESDGRHGTTFWLTLPCAT